MQQQRFQYILFDSLNAIYNNIVKYLYSYNKTNAKENLFIKIYQYVRWTGKYFGPISNRCEYEQVINSFSARHLLKSLNSQFNCQKVVSLLKYMDMFHLYSYCLTSIQSSFSQPGGTLHIIFRSHGIPA